MTDSEQHTPRPKRDINGIFNIDKPPGMTSHDVVARTRRITGQRKAGHAGTLDPMATGVLPVVLGKATRLVEYLADADKAYRAVLMLGASSDTYDREGRITPTPDALMPSRERVEEALERFRGDIEQVPPMHSAIKIGGKKLYELARAGIEVERQARRVTIKKLELEVFNPPTLQIFIECSKGTYIRSLAHDLGGVLGTRAYLQDLTRTCHGPFSIQGAITLEGLQAAFEQETWREALYPPEYILRGWHTHTATPEEELAVRQGKTLPLPAPPVGGREMLAANTARGELLAVLYWDGERGVWQPRKVFGNALTVEAQEPKEEPNTQERYQQWWRTLNGRNIDGIIETLLDKSHPYRDLALSTLLITRNRKAIPALIQVTLDSADALRADAIEGLGQLQAEEATEALIRALSDDNLKLRKKAVHALGSIADERALEPLLGMLASLGDKAPKPNKELVRSVIAALGAIGNKRAVEPLLGILQDERFDKHNRSTAGYVLGQLADERALEPLLNVVQDSRSDEKVRSAAIFALGSMQDERAFHLLLTIAQDRSNTADLRCAAILRLATRQYRRAYDHFTSWVLDETEEREVRLCALHALVDVHHTEAARPLIEALGRVDSLRSRVIEALGRLGSTQAVAVLLSMLNDSDPENEDAVMRALADLGDERAIEPLRARLYNEDGKLNFVALDALCRLHDHTQYHLLIELLESAEPDARYSLIRCLSELEDPRSVNFLAEMLEHEEDHDNRGELAEALARLGNRSALPSLLKVQEKYKNHIIRDWGMDAVDRAIEKLRAGRWD